ncbi:hypothetical protein [Flavobacterium inviolabile]|uniref:hypothetical protein n=1 Tax=Flavobacterium inviolabile TaxID=2748320 RepID=UPI0015AE2D1B|nr:hypothetical protein [Flavobacterium inviolabile]
MKKILFSSIFILGLVFCKSNNTSLNNLNGEWVIHKSNQNIYEISKLDSIENVYLVYAKKNDSIFKIMSSKDHISNCTPIKKGDLLELKLKSTFRENFNQRRDIAGVNFNGTIIRFEKAEGIVRDLFVTDNIKGLCYIKS